MTMKRLAGVCVVFVATSTLGVGWSLCAEPPAEAAGANDGKAASAKADKKVDARHRVSLDVARDRAAVMHDLYASTLETLHHHYFHGDRATVPARAMEDVFAEIAAKSNVEARWIAVNLKAMSLDHEPQNEFEKTAAKKIAAGEAAYDVVEDGFYRRAGAIPLGSGCVGCHGGFFKPASKTPRFAGLVISIPIKGK